MPNVKVGDTIYRFDSGVRNYLRDENGKAIGGSIYRDHWVPAVITGETSRSWLLGDNSWSMVKVPKKGANPKQYKFSLSDVEDDVWLHVNRYGISQRVLSVNDVAVLKKIADLLSY